MMEEGKMTDIQIVGDRAVWVELRVRLLVQAHRGKGYPSRVYPYAGYA